MKTVTVKLEVKILITDKVVTSNSALGATAVYELVREHMKKKLPVVLHWRVTTK